MTNDELRQKATDLYIRVKEKFLLAEETSEEFKDFLQPTFEINRAFDHLMRIDAVGLGLIDNDHPDEYIRGNLEKAIGHLYRAFFDIVDWLSLELRNEVIEEFGDFSHECIADVMPEYYSEVRPKVDELSEKIATIRSKKDVTDSGTIAVMEEYAELVQKFAEKVKVLKKKKIIIIKGCNYI